MVKRVILAGVIGFLAFPCTVVFAQVSVDDSADAGQLFLSARHLLAPIELESHHYTTAPSDSAAMAGRLRQACLLLEAAVRLDKANGQAIRELFTLYISDVIDDPGRAYQCLMLYYPINPDDAGPVENWISYRLNSFNDRQGREDFLLRRLPQFNRYPGLYSKILTQLGIMAMEKGIVEGQQGARNYFENAFSVMPNNVDALARLLSLGPPQLQKTDKIDDAAFEQQKESIIQKYQYFSVLRWRMRIQNNPYDFDALYQLIDTLENLGYYEAAANYYPFAYQLLDTVSANLMLRNTLRFRQMINLYSLKNYPQSLALAQDIIKDNPDDLLTTVAQAKILKKLNRDDESNKIFQHAQDLAAAAMVDPVGTLNAEKAAALAWYFCFIQLDPARAVQLAQTACEKNESEHYTRSLLACVSALNGSFEPAEEFLKTSPDNNPFAVLAQAVILIKKQQDPKTARKILNSLPTARWGLLDDYVAALLAGLPPDGEADTTAQPQQPLADVAANQILAVLKNNFNNDDLKLPAAPQKFIHCSLRLSTDVFSYGDPIDAKLYLSNIGTIDLVFGPDNAVNPHLLITAAVVPMRQNQPVAQSPEDQSPPLLVLHRYMADRPALSPGRSIILTEPLNIGPLRDILQNHPQQSYQITFQMILDPIPDGRGGFLGKIPAVQPAPMVIVRKGLIPTASVMDFHFDLLQHSATDSKIKALGVLAGLLGEKQLADAGKIDYPLSPIDADKIWGGITAAMSDPDYRLQAWAADALRGLTISPDQPAARQLIQLLEDSNWFARFMATQTLGLVADLQDYLDWAQKQQLDPILARQIQWLLGKPWQSLEIPPDVEPTAKK